VSVNVRIEEEKEVLEEQQQHHHHHSTNNEQLLDEVRGERKHQRSAINEEIEGEEEEAISPKAWATRIRTVDKVKSKQSNSEFRYLLGAENFK